jgi:N-acetylmuramoyl-L-alanine amidase CwlA
MSHFIVQVEHFTTADAFRTHLNKHNPSVADWAKGIVLHHTWLPTIDTWRGSRTLNGIVNYYKGKGWTTGPHLFIAKGSRNPDDDGIWQMTPLNVPGTHAAAYNRSHWGIEVVGNYDIAPWPDPTKQLVCDTVAALCKWKGISVTRSTLLGHRETGSQKTCPGRKINMDFVRADLIQIQKEGTM